MYDSRGVAEVIDDCVVRPAIESDLLGLLQLFSRADEGIRPEVGTPSAIEVSTWHTMLATDDMTVYVAERSGQIVGSVTFMVMPHLSYECRPRGFIEAMVVAATQRRSGIGRRLMERVLADASDRQVPQGPALGAQTSCLRWCPRLLSVLGFRGRGRRVSAVPSLSLVRNVRSGVADRVEHVHT